MVKPSFIKSLTTDGMSKKDYVVEFLLYNDFSCFLRRAGRFILRLFRWTPVLWKQEEWDYEFIYDHLELKMKELYKEMSKDTWHDQKEVRKGLKQIKVCLQRLNRWRNWPAYYEYTQDSIKYKDVEESSVSTDSGNEQILDLAKFEQKNYDKFWKDFLAWHRGWWT